MAPPGARASGFGCLVTSQHQAKPGSADIVPFNHYLSMLHLKKKKKKKEAQQYKLCEVPSCDSEQKRE